MPNFALRSTRVVTAENCIPATVVVQDGLIDAILPYDESPACEVTDIGDHVLLPGLLDVHTHVNEPGRTEWEGYAHATRAAAAGGYTTIVDMPLNNLPETSTVEYLELKLRCAETQSWIDYGIWGGVVDYNRDHIVPLAEAGVLGYKCFLAYPGIEGFTMVDEEQLRNAMPLVAQTGLPLLTHAELEGPIDAARAVLDADPSTDWHKFSTYLASRPPASEVDAVRLMISLCREFGARVHIVHLSAVEALPDLEAARAEGLPITVETCPHYLCFAAEEIGDGQTLYKCAPPIREGDNREELWAALGRGAIDMIATDHSPCVPEMKRRGDGSFLLAWGGIASIQCALPAIWKQAHARGVSLQQIAQWMSQRPAALAGLDRRKGTIAVGMDADFVVFDDSAEWTLEADQLFSRHKLSPYVGHTLRGKVLTTFLRGQRVFDQGQHSPEPLGRRCFR